MAPPANAATSHDDDQCQPGQAALAVRLLRRLGADSLSSGDGGGGNLVFSPLSIHAALALAAAGARGGTLDELLAVLGAPSRDELARFVGDAVGRALADRSASGGPRVAFACAAWCDAARRLKPAYRDAVVESYKATVSTADFRNEPKEAMKKMNAWVAEATRNLITKVAGRGAVRRDTVLVLANAVYFKGKWENPFDVADTTDKKFYLLDGSYVMAPFMRSWDDRLIACHDGFKVLKLPYQDDDEEEDGVAPRSPRFAMCFFLPSARGGIPALVDRIASDEGFLLRHLPTEHVAVGRFYVPKFTLSFSGSVARTLKKLGLRLPFDRRNADLSDMVEEEEKVFVRDVIHKAVVEVREEGSEAAAVTVESYADDTCTMEDPDDEPPRRKRVDFVADHPFAFFVVEETSRAVVFAGQVLDPTLED
ncbi:putative serpin-Z6A [Oryza glaberrima]|uniref:putative serpin-Z6A n=1 Tax=Oryza glaberrima TaxID=4538 RepID=UPI00224C4A21|nr:putative serpin-Z6A [Oryza glaberrima]